MIPKSQLISLSEVPGMGPRRIRALLRKFPELEDITNLSKSDMMQVEGISGDLAALVQLFEKKMDITIRVEDIISINNWSTGRNETIVPLITAGGQIQLASLLLGIEMGSHVMGNSTLNYNAGFEFHQQDEIVIFRGGISRNHLFSVGIGLNLKMEDLFCIILL